MKILVTGATGFLGGATAKALHAQGHEVLATGRDPHKAADLIASGIAFVAADLSHKEAALALCKGVEAVCHCAALASPWGARAAFVSANVTATEHLIEGCARFAVRRLVHISTPSIYNTGRDRFAVSEDEPLPHRQRNLYAQTKRAAEDAVLRAAAGGLEVVILRPRAIFGPGDTTLMPRLVRALQTKRLPQLGDGKNRVDMTYIDNVVEAIRCALIAPPAALGKPFNITNGEPRPLWEVIGSLCDALALPKPRRKLPYALAYAAASAVEAAHALLRKQGEPTLTRQGVDALALSMTLDIRAATRLLGYRPVVNIDEGLSRFVAWWREKDHAAP